MLVVDTLGLDPSLQHGSLVQSRFIFEPAQLPRLASWGELYRWTKSSDTAMEPGAGLSSMKRLSLELLKPLEFTPGLPVGVDWDYRSVFWDQRRIPTVTLGMWLGYFGARCHTRGTPLVFITPAQVRKALGLPIKAPKLAVHSQLRAFFGISPRLSSDCLDALALSYVVALGVRRAQHDAH